MLALIKPPSVRGCAEADLSACYNQAQLGESVLAGQQCLRLDRDERRRRRRRRRSPPQMVIYKRTKKSLQRITFFSSLLKEV